MIKQLSIAVAAVALITIGAFAVIDSMAPTQQERAAEAKEAATAPAEK
jgi:hypothetical protein